MSIHPYIYNKNWFRYQHSFVVSMILNLFIVGIVFFADPIFVGAGNVLKLNNSENGKTTGNYGIFNIK